VAIANRCALFFGSAHAELTHGLSRMMGNHQVRFLGEGAAAMPFPYPTPAEVGGGGPKGRRQGGYSSHQEPI
jgi:hypothetical protein